IQGCKIFRVEASIFYFNQIHVYDQIKLKTLSGGGGVRMVIIDLSSAPIVDVSGSRMLLKLSRELEKEKISLRIVDALSDVRELLRRLGMEEIIGHISRRTSIQDAVDLFLAGKISEIR
ncbi:MAG: sodium-independent anion transporter, partial [Bacteroidota bacterium]